MAPRHPAAPPSPGLGDYLGGKGRHRQRILRDVPKNHTNVIQSYLVQGTVLGSGTGQTQPRTNQNVPDARGEHSLLLALRDTSFFWGARDGGGSFCAQSCPGMGLTDPSLGGCVGQQTPMLLQLCWGRGGSEERAGDFPGGDTLCLAHPLPGGRNLALGDSLQRFAQGCYSW